MGMASARCGPFSTVPCGASASAHSRVRSREIGVPSPSTTFGQVLFVFGPVLSSAVACVHLRSRAVTCGSCAVACGHLRSRAVVCVLFAVACGDVLFDSGRTRAARGRTCTTTAHPFACTFPKFPKCLSQSRTPAPITYFAAAFAAAAAAAFAAAAAATHDSAAAAADSSAAAAAAAGRVRGERPDVALHARSCTVTYGGASSHEVRALVCGRVRSHFSACGRVHVRFMRSRAR